MKEAKDYYKNAYCEAWEAFRDAQAKFGGRVRAIRLSDWGFPIEKSARNALLARLDSAGIPFIFKKATGYGCARIYVRAQDYERARALALGGE